LRFGNSYRRSDDFNFGEGDFDSYLNSIIHDWLKALTTLGYTLVPAFFLLDYFTMPTELLPRFGIYRLISTLICLIQYYIIRNTKPGVYSYYHGYFVSINIGGIIALMTVDLGGFNSSYYAGLNLVIIGVNLLLPWKSIHSAINSLVIILMYIMLNLMSTANFDPAILANNLFFMTSTAIIAVSINHLKYNLIKKEFYLLVELKKARDALWSEMELAKRIQTALLPDKQRIGGFEIATAMIPAKEVGGDYYDIIETPEGDKWVTIGDVSGHGVDSGLIMMMAQTCISSTVTSTRNCQPSELLNSVNQILRENISRLGSDHYMTMMAIRFNESKMTIAGKHQDVILYRSALNNTETIPTNGTWLGITDQIDSYLTNIDKDIDDGDIVLLFSDGVTESTNNDGEMFGQARLEQELSQYADLPIRKILEKILEDVSNFQEHQYDDMSLVIVKKCPPVK
jgi:serine phosphatase RsbU (regulator of sigma subunit)